MSVSDQRASEPALMPAVGPTSAPRRTMSPQSSNRQFSNPWAHSRFPEVTRHFKFQPNQPALGIVGERHDFPHPGRGVALGGNHLQPHLNALHDGAGETTPHPCAFTMVVLHCSKKRRPGSRLVTSTGISSGSRVLRRMALCVFSDVSMESDGNDGLPRETPIRKAGALSRAKAVNPLC